MLAIAAFYYMRTCAAYPPLPLLAAHTSDRLLACSDPWRCCVYYLLSGFMDALDGHAARKWCVGRSAAGLACHGARRHARLLLRLLLLLLIELPIISALVVLCSIARRQSSIPPHPG